MKKFLVFCLVSIVILLGISALADGQWHYCDICGREHSGTKCPEECQNECNQNQKGEHHKWHHCEERVISECWYCGEPTINHYENCCPEGAVIWNDIKGTFRNSKYSDEEGARLPQYCKYCEHYGYHHETECLNNPNAQRPTATPTPTATPKPTSTATPVACRHEEVAGYSTLLWTQVIATEDNCLNQKVRYDVICKACGEIVSTREETGSTSHNMQNGRCVTCGFAKVVATATPVACQHEEIAGHVTVLWTNVIASEKTCLHQGKRFDVICKVCGEVVSTSEVLERTEHNIQNGRCVICGFSKVVASPTMSPTLAPTMAPMVCAHEKCDTIGTIVWEEVVGIRGICKAERIRYDVICQKCGEVVGNSYEENKFYDTHDIRNGKCVECGFVEQLTIPTATQEPENNNSESDINVTHDNAKEIIMWIIIGILVGIVIALVVKKK